jgi:hypothetical protein
LFHSVFVCHRSIITIVHIELLHQSVMLDLKYSMSGNV